MSTDYEKVDSVDKSILNINKGVPLFDNGKTCLKLMNNKLFVIDSNKGDIDQFAIKVCDGFYIELGRSILEIQAVLANSTIPIVFERTAKVYGYTHYNIVRMKTDDVNDLVLGTLICKDDIIEKITCDSSYKTKLDFLKRDDVGMLWKGSFFRYTNDAELNQTTAKTYVEEMLKVSFGGEDCDAMNCIDVALYVPNAIVQEQDYEDIKDKIERYDIDNEFSTGDLDYAARLLDGEDQESFDSDERIISDTPFLGKYKKVERFKESYNGEGEVIGNIALITTYSTVKIEVLVIRLDDETKYKYTFILNESTRSYELISISLV